MKRLPIGIQTFSELRRLNCVYVDKTEHIHRLLTTAKTYFLSRPRRFGKSMTISTIKSIYQGEKHLFGGLWIEDKWDWSRRNPVIHIQFASMDYSKTGLEEAISHFCDEQSVKFEVVLTAVSIARKFEELIKKVHDKYGSVVILIDEYDKPIIDYLEKLQRPMAEENRRILRDFYKVIKDADPFIEFFFMTGVSKFSQTGIFSHLNHLRDITIHDDYLDLVGYTQAELEFYFSEWIDYAQEKFKDWTREQLLKQIKLWYNGYSWDGIQSVYNPYSILLFLDQRSFEDHWFKTGTPTFLLDLIKQQKEYNYNNLKTNSRMVASYDIENLDLRTILFQTGYLTVKYRNRMNGDFILDYPNHEVEYAMSDYIISTMTGLAPSAVVAPIYSIREGFQAHNLQKVITNINVLLRGIPSMLLKGKKEDFYHALVHLLFRYLGFEMDSETHTSDGRMDAVVKTTTHIYIIEFKINETADVALQQIKDKGYADPFHADGRQITLLGITFDTRKKAVKDWKPEDV